MWENESRGPREMLPLIQMNPREPRGQREPTPEPRTEADPRAALKSVSKEKRRRSPGPRATATHITPAVLDAHNIGVLGKRDHRIHWQVQPRVGWDAVQHHRNWRQVSHLRGAEKRGEASCPRPEAAEPGSVQDCLDRPTSWMRSHRAGHPDCKH